MHSGKDVSDVPADDAIDAANAGKAASLAVQAEGLPASSPDVIEQELGDQIDNIVPTRGYTLTPTVGLGGSAGGIQALIEFFRAMPADSGLVFVVVLHLSPEHDSTLAELLARHTLMPVVQAEDGMAVEPNRVYVIPPRKYLSSVDGHLRLTPLEPERGKRMTVDVFFRTLADTHGAHATAIVLSGVDSDGAIGLKRIKERGGLTVAQDPAEAEQDGMPRSAIQTGMVDWVLRAAEIPARLVEYTRSERRLRLPTEDEPSPVQPPVLNQTEDENTLRDILAYLHTCTGHDFSYYKRATVLRRVSRRLQINAVETLGDYLSFLRTHPGESGALLQDLLISVTNFFRDREAFAVLEEQIPALFAGKGPADHVRVWVSACATGEEAYSIAMLLSEHARTLTTPPHLQVFATDLAEEAIQAAREGVYPLTISTDVSTERLARFFVKEHRGYRVRRELREIVLFARHDLLKDSPFSKLDLVTCRNLLIYLNRDAQLRALEVFHFALLPGGRLFLGTSESVDDGNELFVPQDKKYRLYVARDRPRGSLPMPVGPNTLTLAIQARERATEGPVLPKINPAQVVSPSWEPAPDRNFSQETRLRLLSEAGPPTIIVDGDYQIVHLSAAASRYLEFDADGTTRNLPEVVHPSLRIELRAALFRAVQTQRPVRALGVLLDLDDEPRKVDLRVQPSQQMAGCCVISFHPHATSAPADQIMEAVASDPVARELERELKVLQAHLRDVQERHEVTVEEHKAGSEELQAINEELRSASEELETSREELQSINEELSTVNQELKSRIEELGDTNSDLQNLMAATQIATVFLDRDLRITRYTPNAVSLFKLIATDVGRPLEDIKHRLDYPDLEEDAAKVLADLSAVERAVSKQDGGWFLARLQPYRTLDDHIAGVVLTFVDITERKEAEQALRASEEKYRTLFEAIDQGFYRAEAIFDDAGRCVDILYHDENSAAARMTGQSFEGRRLSEIGAYEPYWLDIFGQTARTGQPQRLERYAEPDGRWYDFYVFKPAQAQKNELAVVFGDVTGRKRAEQTQAFLLKLSDALRPLSDPVAIQQTAMQVLGAHLGVHRAFYGELQDDNDTLIIGPGYSHDLPALVGTVKFSEFDSDLVAAYRAGQTVIYNDIYVDAQLSSKARAAFDAIQVRAAVGVALVKEGKVRAIVSLHQAVPRRWVAEEIALLEETAERTWAAVERARIQVVLRESETRLRAVLEQVPLAIVLTGSSGDILFRNTMFDQLWGRPAHVTTARTYSDVYKGYHLDGRLVASEEWPGSRAVLKGETVQDEVIEIVQANGARLPCWFAAAPVRDSSEQIIGGVVLFQDNTERKRPEEALRAALQEAEQARSEAEAAGAAKDHFLAVLSHELRTPLMPITMALALLERRPDVPAEVRRMFETIKRNVELEKGFIDDMLDVTRVARGKMEIVRADMDLHEAVRRAIEVSTPDIVAKGQRLGVSLEGSECRLQGDFARLQQVFWNLLKNASKFTPEGGGVEIRSLCAVGQNYVVEVVDTGIGMEAEAVERIFQPFEQANVSITREFGGLGLGLAIAKATVEAHGGTLRASSPGPGQGATFTVSLPLAVPDTEAASDQT